MTVNFEIDATLTEALHLLEKNKFFFHRLYGFKYVATGQHETSAILDQMQNEPFVSSCEEWGSADSDYVIIWVNFRNIRTKNLEDWKNLLSLHQLVEHTGDLDGYDKQAWVSVPEGEEEQWIKAFEKEPIVQSAHVPLSPCTVF